jgi:hypothetical protein
MAWPFAKKPGEAETEEDKKQLDAFIDRIGASFEAKLEEKLKPIREEVSTVKTKWENLEKVATATDDTHKTEEDANLTDEQKRALNDRKMLALTIATNARITEGEIVGEVIGQGLSDFVPKIKEYFQNTPLERKGQADYAVYCRNIVDMVVGSEARRAGLRLDGNKKFFLEDAAGKGGENQQYDFLAHDMAWTDPRSGKTYSASEQLAKLGIKPEEFADSIKKGVV